MFDAEWKIERSNTFEAAGQWIKTIFEVMIMKHEWWIFKKDSRWKRMQNIFNTAAKRGKRKMLSVSE